ncbi:Ppx/GppA phosphatase family protein [Garciella nitratireducens]|uniref:Exopolyphosphatase / guanosine-5'-triphosphate,3'-diphosphate pyrophosphatase n=1 Tax=Garciella nitratireducens DSM 15102 TaxID=1121911 RepID=A0A1T4L5C4_9FIRM|nr:Ppx/GppA phosphatase family protein [Garciella nitratireducens]SJZ49925.1 exopolyphosphatase / guanosine-5'-triphosphate,3'-diphosphate pyrophosphatase [Garciella nitratireducens DSM 15102]
MQKIAVIDIGTNSMRYMISEIEQNKIVKCYKTLKTTRIGEGMQQKGEISSQAFDRNLKALKEFKEQAEKQGAKEIIVFGTSALRDAKNAKEFISIVQRKLNLSIEILTGEQEARIGFQGAIEGVLEDVLVIDIGGGSTEFIYGNQKKGILGMTSLNIGALRMKEIYIYHDPVKEEELLILKQRIKETLQEGLSQSFYNMSSVMGIGGTITTLSSIKQNMKEYDSKKIHHSKLLIQDVRNILKRLKVLNLEQRKKIVGLQPSRADIIIAGIVILLEIMETLKIEELLVSEKDTLEGMLLFKLRMKK